MTATQIWSRVRIRPCGGNIKDCLFVPVESKDNASTVGLPPDSTVTLRVTGVCVGQHGQGDRMADSVLVDDAYRELAAAQTTSKLLYPV
ncbi:hypothetical protein J6590_013880 [Homalodisca vitripennis]|nr:hypothetical protein J6590_013880 [Homalodisca vitripennis]